MSSTVVTDAPPPRRSVATASDESAHDTLTAGGMGAVGALGVLFCGTLEKRHPYTGATYPRFVVLTASAIHWFKRPQHHELFGEPRGTLWLNWLRGAVINGHERRELVLEFDSPSPLGAIYSGQPSAIDRGGLPRVQSAESLRAPSSKYERFLGKKRSFVAPTAAAAIAWRAAIELAMREARDEVADESARFAVSLATANPSSIADYLNQDMAIHMEDGYGDAIFLEALGRLIEEDDEYALPPIAPLRLQSAPNSADQHSPVMYSESRRRYRERSETKFVTVATFRRLVVARDLIYKVPSSSELHFRAPTFTITLDDYYDLDDEGLVLALSDGSSAAFSLSALDDALVSDARRRITAELTDPRIINHRQSAASEAGAYSPPRRVFAIKITHDDSEQLSQLEKIASSRNVAFLVIFAASLAGHFLLKHTANFWTTFQLVLCLAACLAPFNSLLRRKRRSVPCVVEIIGERFNHANSAAMSGTTGDKSRAGSLDATGGGVTPEAIDPKFLSATKGDRVEAERRWSQSIAWRRKLRVDDILHERQPYFHLIKDAYPHWLGGRSRKNELVYWERPGYVDLEKLRNSGVTLEAMIRHYIFANEWTWRVLSPASYGPESFQVVVLDVAGIRLSDVTGLRLEYFKTCAEIAQLSYPDRTSMYIVINAPGWLPAAYRVVEPFLSPETRRRVCIKSAGRPTTEKLLEVIPSDHIPEVYGGTFAPGQSIDVARRRTPEEVKFNKYVDNINNGVTPE